MKIRRLVLVGLTLVGCLALSASTASAALEGDYRFQNDYKSSVLPALDLEHPGAPTSHTFVSETVDGTARTVNTFMESSGYRLLHGGFVPGDPYTVVVLARFDDLGGFVRVIDFKDGASDNGLYLHRRSLRFYDHTRRGPTEVARDQWVQIVLTRSGAGRVKGYVDGVRQWSFDDGASADAVFADTDPKSIDHILFFLDNLEGGGTGENSSGAVARIRLYDRALSATAVAALNREPPLLKASATQGAPGDPVTLRGYGFSPGETVKLEFHDTEDQFTQDSTTYPLGFDTANGRGNFVADVTVPATAVCNDPDYFRATGQASDLGAESPFGLTVC